MVIKTGPATWGPEWRHMPPDSHEMDILSEIDEIENFALADILDLDSLQKLQDAFAHANGIASTITDPQGNPLTRPSNHCPVCAMVRATAKGQDRCALSSRVLGQKSRQLMEPYFQPCLSMGFLDAIAPIVVRDRHLANWVMGQACVGSVDEARVADYAREIGADHQVMLAAFHNMPRMPQEEFERKLDFLWRMARQISQLGYNNLKFSRTLTQLKVSQWELAQYKQQLEHLVEDRTRELRQAMQEIKWLSQTDSLTGSFNRRYIGDNLLKEIKRARRYHRGLSVVLADLDHFKSVNDNHGHQCGDLVLLKFVEMIQASIRQGVDWVARYGGEEFLIVLPETELHEAETTAQRLRSLANQARVQCRDQELAITASYGVCALDFSSQPSQALVEEMINSADTYLYQAKQQGRDRIIAGPLLKKN